MPPGDPEPCSLVKATTGQRRHLDRHGHRLHRVGGLVEIPASAGPLPLLGVPASPPSAGPEVPPGDPEPFSLVQTTTGQRRHLDRHGHRLHRVGGLVEILAGAGPLPLLDVLASPQRRPEVPPGEPEPCSLVNTTTGQRRHLDHHGRRPKH